MDNSPFISRQDICLLSSSRRIFIFRDENDQDGLAQLKDIIKIIRANVNYIVIYAVNENYQKKLDADDIYDATMRLTCAIVLGTDNTMLSFVGLFYDLESPPILGIGKEKQHILYNFTVDRLSFIMEGLIQQLKKREMITETCYRLEVKKVNRLTGEKTPLKRVALSEISIHRGKSGSCVRLDIYIDGYLLTNFVGDGVIFATPYGSLAYSLASNGPILSNKTNGLTLVPICPLSMSFRPICLPNNMIIRIELNEKSRTSGTVTCDGYRPFLLAYHYMLYIKLSDRRIKMVCGFDEQNLTKVWIEKLRGVLNWGSQFSA